MMRSDVQVEINVMRLCYTERVDGECCYRGVEWREESEVR